jgi:hypothetical protein
MKMDFITGMELINDSLRFLHRVIFFSYSSWFWFTPPDSSGGYFLTGQGRTHLKQATGNGQAMCNDND